MKKEKNNKITHLASYLLKCCFLLTSLKPKKSLLFNNKKYKHHNSRYYFSWASERTAEIPIVYEAFSRHNKNSAAILEIGNVLSNHIKKQEYNGWDIVDKYEKAEGVINQDVVEYSTSKKYDFIFSISTMEHVGYDESIKDITKFERSVNHLKSLLNDYGTLMITIPLGYNKELDNILFSRKIFTKCFFLKRNNMFNEWSQINIEKKRDFEYGFPLAANYLLIGVYTSYPKESYDNQYIKNKEAEII